MSDQEAVYILSNPRMPGLVKIGRTTAENLKQRIRTLSSSPSIPMPFVLEFAGTIKHGIPAERILHKALKEKRINKKREFFETSPEEAYELLEMLVDKRIFINEKDLVEDKEDKINLIQAIKKEKKQIENFNFDMVNIEDEEILYFSKDKNITCIVKGGNKVFFQGNQETLTSAARKVLKQLGTPLDNPRGPYYWHYKNENLVKMRERVTQELLSNKEEIVKEDSSFNRNITFDKLKIQQGEELNFKLDKKTVCYVHDDRLVKYNNEPMSFVQATRKAYKKFNKLNSSESYRPIREWSYKGVLLEDKWNAKKKK